MRRRRMAGSVKRTRSNPGNSAALTPPSAYGGLLDPPAISTASVARGATHPERRGRSLSPAPSPSATGRASSETRTRAAAAAAAAADVGWHDAALSFLFRLAFWPLTVSLMLTGSAYHLLLRLGCGRGRSSASAARFRQPPRWLIRAASKLFRLANPPVVFGAENLGGGSLGPRPGVEPRIRRDGAGGWGRVGGRGRPPMLLVGNHCLLGLDCVAVLDEVQGRTGLLPRVLYDTLFGSVPGWKQVAEATGGVKGTMGNCEALMSEGRCLLLYPGGAREAFKRRKVDKYRLMWHEKLGFARLAVKHGYSLVPFASVGIEDAVSVAFSIDIACLVRRAEPDSGRLRIPFLFPYNSLERQYFAFGAPIETAHLGGDWESLAKSTEVYGEAKVEVERLVRHLQQVQEQDPDRYLVRRVWRSCCRMVGGLTGDSGVVPGIGLAGHLGTGK